MPPPASSPPRAAGDREREGDPRLRLRLRLLLGERRRGSERERERPLFWVFGGGCWVLCFFWGGVSRSCKV